MHGARLQSIIPVGAVPQQVRVAATSVLKGWGHSWAEVSLAGTVALPSQGTWHADDVEAWVIAVHADALNVGDEFGPGEGRAAGVQASGRLGGVIPAIAYPVQVFESLRRRGGGPAPERQPPFESPTVARRAPVAQGQRR